MPNNLNNMKDAPGAICKAAAKTLHDHIAFCKSVDKVPAKEFEGNNGFGAGDTVYVSKPARFVPQDSFDITSTQQDIVEEKVPLTLDIISTLGVNITSMEFATEIQLKDTIKRVVRPAMESIAHDFERRCVEKATDAVYNANGTPGSTAFTTQVVLAGRTRLNKGMAPKGMGRFNLFESEAGASAVDDRKGSFQDASEIAKQYKEGFIGRADGFNWMESELMNVHTNGNDVTGVAMDGSTAEGASTIHVDGLTTSTGTLTKGTVFTIAGVYAVHPITKVAYTHLQQFVVTADVTADGSGDADVAISPAIYAGSDGLQNVDALPADNAAITIMGAADGAYVQNLQYHKSAFRVCTVPLVMPEKAEFAAQETYKGITVAIIRDFDIKTRKMITRLDVLGGLVADRPEFANRIYS